MSKQLTLSIKIKCRITLSQGLYMDGLNQDQQNSIRPTYGR